MKIFFDLDGTLFDSKARLYQLFQHLVPISNLSFDDYWALKMDKISHATLLKRKFAFTETELVNFEYSWMNLIEQPEWLALDKPLKGLKVFLEQLKKDNELYIVTARQFEDKLYEQLKQHQILSYFETILVTNQKKEKLDLISPFKVTKNDWLVGDTGKDIQTGKQLGMKTAGVLTGFLNKKKLSEYNPDVLVTSIFDLDFNVIV